MGLNSSAVKNMLVSEKIHKELELRYKSVALTGNEGIKLASIFVKSHTIASIACNSQRLALREMGVPNVVCCNNPGPKKDLMEELGFKTVAPDELEANYKELSDGLGFELVYIGTSDSTVKHVRMAVELLAKQQEAIKKIVTILPLNQALEGMNGVKVSKKYAKVVLIL